MKTATILFAEDGSTSLLYGPEVLFSEQRAAVQKFRNEGLPEGIVLVEIWERKRLKNAVRTPIAIEPAANESAEEEDAQKVAQAPKAPKPPKPPKAKPADESPNTAPAKDLPTTPPSTIAEFVARNTPPADELGS